ncbi:DNA repair protein rhp26 [Coemansia sp. RSA 2399]|nr:DNA repair protein rhp26 [Coemansia sp. RSA 2399]KAJ1906189.1 DNA repair protein rhp26 [Coemansia sp. IMI 209127]
MFDWCAARWRARQSGPGEDQVEQFAADQGSSLDCVAIDGQQVPRAQLSDEPILPDPGSADHVVKSHDRGKPSLRVPRQIWEKLLEYQKACMHWLFALHQQNAGGILGDEMGLGKTVQTAAFLASMYHSQLLDRPSIIVCPATLLRQWVGEFHAWWPALRVVILHGTGYGMRVVAGEDLIDAGLERDLSTDLPKGMEADAWKSAMSENPGFGAEGNAAAYDSADDYEYDAYGLRVRRKRRPRGYVDWRKRQQKKQKMKQSKKNSKASSENLLRAEKLVDRIHRKGHVVIVTYSGLQIYQDVLLRRKWGYAVLDEGHTIRNPDADVTIACKRLDTRHRVLVTGTPIQNNLAELWSLFDFIFPGRLGTLPVFNNQFAIPITVGGYASANSLQVRAAYRCACILRDLIDPYLLRRLKADVAQDLPQKSEQVLFCRLTPMQRKAYKAFLQSTDMERILSGKLQMLFGVDVARKICDHPDLLLLSTLPSAAGNHRESSTIKEVIAQASEARNASGHKNNINDNSDGAAEYVGSIDSEDEAAGVGNANTRFGDLPPDYGSYEKSGKLTIVRALLKMWKPQGHKVLIFSQTRQMLDIIESMMVNMPGTNYRRMDGATPVQRRAALINEYNNNPDIYVFLLTTKVGGLGINLTGANRVILYSPDWNPSSDMQARERAWRLGQKRDVAIYRLMTAGTIEEKIYNRQIYKQFLTNKILADPKQKRFFHSQSLRDLFSLSGLGDGEDVFPGMCQPVAESSAAKRGPGFGGRAGGRDRPTREESPQLARDSPPRHVTDTGRVFADAQLFPGSSGDNVDNADNVDVGGGGQIESIGGVVRLEEYRTTNKSGASSDSEPGESSTGNVAEARQGSNRQRSSHSDGEGEEVAGQNGEDRVLQSLFKMSGVHSAFQHDVIVNSKDEETQAIDREADRIVQDARSALKQSQRSRNQININVPTWTGAAGNAGMPKTGRGTSSESDPRFVPPPPSAILSNEIPMEVRTLGMRAVGTPRNQKNPPPSQLENVGSESDSTTVYHPSIAARRPARATVARPNSSIVPSLSMSGRSQAGVPPKQTQFGSHAVSGMYSAGSVGTNGGRPSIGVRVESAEPSPLPSSAGNGGGLSSSSILAGLRARAGGIDGAAGISSGDRQVTNVTICTASSGGHPPPPQQQQQGHQGIRRYRTQQLPSGSASRGGFDVPGRSHGAGLARPQRKPVPHAPTGTRNKSLKSNDSAVVRCIRHALVGNGGELGIKELFDKVHAEFAGIEQPRVRQLAQQVADLETRQPKGETSRAGIGRIVQKVWKLRAE